MLVLYLLFPICCILAVRPADPVRKGAVAERVVYGIALYEFLLLFIGLFLGSFDLLNRTAYGAAIGVAAVVLAARGVRNPLPIQMMPLAKAVRTRRGSALLVMGVLIVLTYLLQLGIDAVSGTRHIDGLWYHIPRVIFWLQQGNFDPWPTPVWSQIGLPLGADVVLGNKILLGSGWRGIGYVTAVLTAGAVASVYVAALDLGYSRWSAAVSALLFSSFPVVGLRIWSMNSDITAAFPLLAGYVAVHRMRDRSAAIAVFIGLTGVALACKQTVVFQALLLAGILFWQCRQKLFEKQSFAPAAAAAVLSACLIIFSFLPVYRAFGDLDGGPGGRGHRVTSVSEFTHSVAMSTCHWLLEPLGYLTPIPPAEHAVKSIAKRVYNAAGARFSELPEMWKPWPAQDIGRSGLAPLLALPLLLLGLPRGKRGVCALIFLLGFLPLSGILHPSPYFARYTIVVLAGFALLWGAARFFRNGATRWLLAVVTAVNILSLLGVVAMRFYVDTTVKSAPGGPYYYLSDGERGEIARSLHGRPLQVLTSDSLDAFLVGPEIGYRMQYLIAPDDGDWNREMDRAGRISNWLAIVHHGKESVPLAADGDVPTMEFPRAVSLRELETALTDNGWRIYRRNPLLDLWTRNIQ